MQLLKADGFNTQIVSVDRVNQDKVCKPYFDFKRAIYERRIKIYQKCDLLTEELVNLEKLASGKIDHPDRGSKDQSDAVCGAMFLASKFAEEYSYAYGETLDANLAVNAELSDEFNKRQMMAAFEEELKQIYFDQGFMTPVEPSRQLDYQQYKDMADGIFII